MLDDHAVSYGRRTNGKYIILLLALAMIALLSAWALEHKGTIQSALSRLLPKKQLSMDWRMRQVTALPLFLAAMTARCC